MAKQDDFVRITLRLPPALHAQLAKAAGAASLNAEIVARLEDSIRGGHRLDFTKSKPTVDDVDRILNVMLQFRDAVAIMEEKTPDELAALLASKGISDKPGL